VNGAAAIALALFFIGMGFMLGLSVGLNAGYRKGRSAPEARAEGQPITERNVDHNHGSDK
jgi:hypothetical protein